MVRDIYEAYEILDKKYDKTKKEIESLNQTIDDLLEELHYDTQE